VKKSVLPLYYKAAQILYGTGRYKEAGVYAKRYLLSFSLRHRHRQRFLLKVVLKAYLPHVYGILKFLKSTLVR